jgi:dolichol-phosphate mannosyltransferase
MSSDLAGGDRSARPDCLIFIPTYNEAENVGPMVEQIRALKLEADLLFVDDNSPDGTGEILDRIAARDERVRVIHREGKQGIGTAHKLGIERAYEEGYRTLITLDGDFTHPPQDIPRLLARAANCDLVVASRHLERDSLVGWQLHRKFLTKSAYFATRHFLGMPFDATGAFRVYRLERIPQELFAKVRSPGYSFFLESLYVLWSNGVKVEQIPVRLPARVQGHSKMRPRDAWQSVVTVLRLALRGARAGRR